MFVTIPGIRCVYFLTATVHENNELEAILLIYRDAPEKLHAENLTEKIFTHRIVYMSTILKFSCDEGKL